MCVRENGIGSRAHGFGGVDRAICVRACGSRGWGGYVCRLPARARALADGEELCPQALGLCQRRRERVLRAFEGGAVFGLGTQSLREVLEELDVVLGYGGGT